MFIKVGKYIINTDQVIDVRAMEPEPARDEERFYEHTHGTYMHHTPAKPFRVILTTTAQEIEYGDETDHSGATVSQTIKFRGEQAGTVWAWFGEHCDWNADEPLKVELPF